MNDRALSRKIMFERALCALNAEEKEIDEMIKLLKKNVIDPEVTNYIFYEENTPEEVVDKALAYKPIIL